MHINIRYVGDRFIGVNNNRPKTGFSVEKRTKTDVFFTMKNDSFAIEYREYTEFHAHITYQGAHYHYTSLESALDALKGAYARAGVAVIFEGTHRVIFPKKADYKLPEIAPQLPAPESGFSTEKPIKPPSYAPDKFAARRLKTKIVGV